MKKGWVYNKIPVHLLSQNDHKMNNNVQFNMSLQALTGLETPWLTTADTELFLHVQLLLSSQTFAQTDHYAVGVSHRKNGMEKNIPYFLMLVCIQVQKGPCWWHVSSNNYNSSYRADTEERVGVFKSSPGNAHLWKMVDLRLNFLHAQWGESGPYF